MSMSGRSARFGIALVFLCILSLGLLFGLFKYFESSVGGSLPDLNVDARRLPPQPQLQKTPIQDLQQMRAAEDQLLNSYGWVDQSKGVVRIPIDQAIDMLAKRGLPVAAARRRFRRVQRQRSDRSGRA